MRILQLLHARELTTHELAQALSDVPPATLYRHLKLLADGEIVSIVAERRARRARGARGALERVYTLPPGRGIVTADEVGGLDREAHRRMFLSFIAVVIGGFERYLTQGRVDPKADGLGYSQATLYLNDEELERYGRELGAVVLRAAALKPRAGRRARTLTTIIVPEPAGGGEASAASEEDGRS